MSWLLSRWSCQSLYGRSLLSKPLMAEETLCAEEIMSGKFKILSYEEMMEKRKVKKVKKKEAVESSPTLKPNAKIVSESEKETTDMKSTEVGSSQRKRKALCDPQEDLENLVIKIPRDVSIFTDPFGIHNFAGSLLLEGDEERLSTLGPVEAAKKAMVLNYQVMNSLLILLGYFLLCFHF